MVAGRRRRNLGRTLGEPGDDEQAEAIRGKGNIGR
jgi:hypothetical protein